MTMVNRIFADLFDQFLVAYVDDILLYSQTLEAHAQYLEITLLRMQQHKLYAKLLKCKFTVPEVVFCGSAISSTGYLIDPEKITAISTFPEPRNVPELQGLLGMVNYSRSFIPNHAAVVAPLAKLLKSKTPGTWTTNHAQAFAQTRLPTLRHFQSKLPTTIHVDASCFARGGMDLTHTP